MPLKLEQTVRVLPGPEWQAGSPWSHKSSGVCLSWCVLKESWIPVPFYKLMWLEQNRSCVSACNSNYFPDSGLPGHSVRGMWCSPPPSGLAGWKPLPRNLLISVPATLFSQNPCLVTGPLVTQSCSAFLGLCLS